MRQPFYLNKKSLVRTEFKKHESRQGLAFFGKENLKKNPHILNVYFWMAFNIMSGVLLHGHQTNNEQ